MIAEIPRWEHRLLSLAEQGIGQVHTAAAPRTEAQHDLRQAYGHCQAITARYSRSFHLASHFLPPHKRRAVRALYAFCRVTDDIVDDPKPDAAAQLEGWRGETLFAAGTAVHPAAVAWRDTQRQFGIPVRYAEQLIEAVGRDLQPAQYESFGALAHYCYGVASTVGLMSMHIIGFSSPAAVRYAVKMGVALQLTNILRDIGEDLSQGRLYLPLDELAAFGIGVDHLVERRADQRWRSFMRFQVGRARRMFQEARPGIQLLHRDGRLAVAAAAELYGGILGEIEAHAYDVFAHRAHLSRAQKLLRIPAIWLRSQSGGWGTVPDAGIR